MPYPDPGVTRQRTPRRGSRFEPSGDEVTQTSLRASAATADAVQGVRTASDKQVRMSTGGGASGRSTSLVLPSIGLVVELVLPVMIMALSLAAAFVFTTRASATSSAWAFIALAPTLGVFFLAKPQTQPFWRHSAILNIVTMGVFYPMLIVRQSYLRVPFLQWGNGTLTMPVISTLVVILTLLVIALAAGWLSREDPEYAGALILPAVLLVPFFAGTTEIIRLSTALAIGAAVMVATAFLSVLVSMLPTQMAYFVAPLALAVEFMLLPVLQDVPIFPTGAGLVAKLLFFVILASTVALVLAMPTLSVWVRRLEQLVRYQLRSATSA